MSQWCGHGVALNPSDLVNSFLDSHTIAAQVDAQGLDTFVDDPVVWHVARGNRQVGVLIDRLALLEQAADGRRPDLPSAAVAGQRGVSPGA